MSVGLSGSDSNSNTQQQGSQALRWVKEGKAQLVFVMQPPNFQEVLKRARAAARQDSSFSTVACPLRWMIST